MAKDIINKQLLIEDLIENYPFSVEFLAKKGIRCIVCGEPIWGTLEEACKEKNFQDSEIDEFIKELSEIYKTYKEE